MGKSKSRFVLNRDLNTFGHFDLSTKDSIYLWFDWFVFSSKFCKSFISLFIFPTLVKNRYDLCHLTSVFVSVKSTWVQQTVTDSQCWTISEHWTAHYLFRFRVHYLHYCTASTFPHYNIHSVLKILDLIWHNIRYWWREGIYIVKATAYNVLLIRMMALYKMYSDWLIDWLEQWRQRAATTLKLLFAHVKCTTRPYLNSVDRLLLTERHTHVKTKTNFFAR